MAFFIPREINFQISPGIFPGPLIVLLRFSLTVEELPSREWTDFNVEGGRPEMVLVLAKVGKCRGRKSLEDSIGDPEATSTQLIPGRDSKSWYVALLTVTNFFGSNFLEFSAPDGGYRTIVQIESLELRIYQIKIFTRDNYINYALYSLGYRITFGSQTTHLNSNLAIIITNMDSSDQFEQCTEFRGSVTEIFWYVQHST